MDAQLTARELIVRLDTVQPLHLAGPALLARLVRIEKAGQMDTETLLQVQPEIDRAIAELEGKGTKLDEVIKRCQNLQPAPSRAVPTGF